MSYPNEFFNLQNAVIARLTAVDPAVPAPVANQGAVTWITEILGDLANLVQKQIGKIGIVGIVLTPGGKDSKMRDPSSYQLSMVCPVLIEIWENVVLNRSAAGTQIAASDLVRFCMKRLNGFSLDAAHPPAGRKITRIECDPRPYDLVQGSPQLVYHVRFLAPLTIQ